MPDTGATAVICFSRSGYTRAAARVLAGLTGAEFHEVTTPRYRRSIVGFSRAILDVLRKRAPALDHIPEVGGYQWVILCGPVWAGDLAAPLRTLLSGPVALPETVGIVLTSAEPKLPRNALATAQELLGRPLAATAHIPNEMDGTSEMTQRLRQMADDITHAAAGAAA